MAVFLFCLVFVLASLRCFRHNSNNKANKGYNKNREIHCLSLVSVAVVNSMGKSSLGKKGHAYLALLVIVHQGKLGCKLEAEPEAEAMEAGPEAEAMKKCCSLVCFLTQSRTTNQERGNTHRVLGPLILIINQGKTAEVKLTIPRRV